ncbi:hypothetical protein Lal_00012682 [Lupinus albus]|uniref:Oleosin n=1 Tax=Lupinus albus TaxID=3870 RepID=A0A6A5NQ42_LUPAL|nr:putative oleosin [Lupinus albus]KAF1883765.1 hypothetical protein Lal_00012682 [Lupinus albus]
MTDRSTPHQVQVHTTKTRYDTTTNPQGRYRGGGGGGGGGDGSGEKGPTTSQVLAILAGLPVSGILFALAGLTLVGTLTGLAVSTPLFILFSPVLVPATIVIGLSVAGFLTSGACGVTALTSFSWVTEYIRQTQGTMPEQLESAKQSAKQGLADVAGYVGQKTKEVGQKTKDVGQEIQTKAQDAKTTT